MSGRVPAGALVGAALLAALSACGPTSTTGMHRVPGASARPGSMTGMMGSAPRGYHFRTPTCAPPAGLPGTTVRVVLGDMGMMRMMGGVAPHGSRMLLRAVPAQVPAGTVSFVVANLGWRTHELVVLPLGDGHRVPGPDGRVSERGSLGEASASCAAGEGEGIRSGAAGWVTLTLPRGHYELVCNLPNHFAAGMHQQLIVR